MRLHVNVILSARTSTIFRLKLNGRPKSENVYQNLFDGISVTSSQLLFPSSICNDKEGYARWKC